MNPAICESLERLDAAHAAYKEALAAAQANPDGCPAWKRLLGCHIVMTQAMESHDATLDDVYPTFAVPVE